jgi:hypothetical protein
MSNDKTWRVASYIVPYNDILIGNLSIKRSRPLIIKDDWRRDHYTGSVEIEGIEYHQLVTSWVYFQSLLADSRLPLYSVRSIGHKEENFQARDFGAKDENIKPREIEFDASDVIPALFLDEPDGPVISYEDMYNAFNIKGEQYLSALKTYFLAQDINFNKRLRDVDTSYWQVVMFVSCLESFLPAPEFCKGKCNTCNKGVNHLVSDTQKEWNNFLFKKIKGKDIRKTYRLILDVARYGIRNNTLHNGFMPSVQGYGETVENGITIFTTERAIENYLSEGYSLESLIDQLRQICRTVLLNALIPEEYYPALSPFQVHSQTVRNITSSKATFELNF